MVKMVVLGMFTTGLILMAIHGYLSSAPDPFTRRPSLPEPRFPHYVSPWEPGRIRAIEFEQLAVEVEAIERHLYVDEWADALVKRVKSRNCAERAADETIAAAGADCSADAVVTGECRE